MYASRQPMCTESNSNIIKMIEDSAHDLNQMQEIRNISLNQMITEIDQILDKIGVVEPSYLIKDEKDDQIQDSSDYSGIEIL